MSEMSSSEQRFPDSLAGLWSEKLQLSSKIEELLKPFCDRYQLRLDQVEVVCNHAGVYVKVTL